MTKTKLDRIIERIAPGMGYRRMVNRHNIEQFRNAWHIGYDGGQTSKRGQNNAYVCVQGEDITAGEYQYRQMRANCMQLYRDDPITQSVVDLEASYLGESRPTAATTDTEWNKRATAYFNEQFWQFCDARQRVGVDFGTFQTQWSRYRWLGGDMLYVLDNGRLFPVEGQQIETPNDLSRDKSIINGVRVDARGRVTHYYIRNQQRLWRSDVATKDQFKRFRQDQVIYAPGPNWRASMLRPVPDLHGVIDSLMTYRQTMDAVAKKVELESKIVTVEKKGSVQGGPRRGFEAAGGTGQKIDSTEVSWGTRMRINGSPKDDFLFSRLENPADSTIRYLEFAARVISAGTGMPYECIMHQYLASYTASRASRVDLLQFLMDRWAWRVKVLGQPVWNWAIARAIKRGQLDPAPVDPVTGISQWHKTTWTLPHMRQIDERKEAMAAADRWQMGTTNLDELAQMQGKTRVQMLDERDIDIEQMSERAAKYGLTLNEYAAKLFPKTQPTQGGQNGA